MFKYLPKNMNGIFAIEKPSGITSSKFLSNIQDIFTKSSVFQKDLTDARNKAAEALGTDKKWSKERINKKVKNLKIKMGHGGTLDPLARGVLVVGVGSGTKKLQYYLGECNKTYETKALLGICTTTGDSEGEIISQNSIDHITSDMIEQASLKFVGSLKQTPPIFSALKMNGKPLYDYAREGIPLPKAIKARNVKVFKIYVHSEDNLSTEHSFPKLEYKFDENNKQLDHSLMNNLTLNDYPLYFSDEYIEKAEKENLPKSVGDARELGDNKLPDKLPMFHLTVDVSSGTYIRSLISDFGRALETSAYMVELIRTKQSQWELNKNVFKYSDFEDRDERLWGMVLKKVLDEGADVIIEEEFEAAASKLNPLLDAETKIEESDYKGSESGEVLQDALKGDTIVPKKRKIESNE